MHCISLASGPHTGIALRSNAPGASKILPTPRIPGARGPPVPQVLVGRGKGLGRGLSYFGHHPPSHKANLVTRAENEEEGIFTSSGKRSCKHKALTHARTHTHTHIHTHTRTHTHAQTYTQTHTRTHTLAHTHIHTCTHAARESRLMTLLGSVMLVSA
jgi:hypothetical protein